MLETIINFFNPVSWAMIFVGLLFLIFGTGVGALVVGLFLIGLAEAIDFRDSVNERLDNIERKL